MKSTINSGFLLVRKNYKNENSQNIIVLNNYKIHFLGTATKIKFDIIYITTNFNINTLVLNVTNEQAIQVLKLDGTNKSKQKRTKHNDR